MGVSSVSSSRTTRSTFSRVHRVPHTGPRNGANRIFVRSPMASRPSSGRLLQLEFDVHEIVRWPRPGVLEGEQILVLPADLLHLLVERFFGPAIHQKRGVENHAVADNLVAPAGDRYVLELLVNVRHVPVARVLHRSLDETAQLHTRKVRR